MRDERLFASPPGGHLTERVPSDDPLLVADSWLVVDGRVRAIGKHRRRFFGSCAEAGVPSEQLQTFWRSALAELPRSGSWFPRVELCTDRSAPLRLRLRPAPPLGTDVRVWIADRADPRTMPQRKGPDLPVLAQFRAMAARRGAQEALLTTRSGAVLEAASSSLLWWEGDNLCVPSAVLPTLPGVTAALIRRRAERLGISVVPRQVIPAHLANREVWLVNALHGIRPVISWSGTSLPVGPAVQAGQWQRWLATQSVPLPITRADSTHSALEVSAG
jgi:branched-subunit amino acid aminotransferase/4-amino-4-deoxychorismate lyase